MATSKILKQKADAVQLPECPVCLEILTAPIFQCKSGHSLCKNCTTSLSPPLCPICRQDMTTMRNWSLEEMIAVAKVSCPNKHLGCIYKLSTMELNEHLKECIYRVMNCPMGIFGKCSWQGTLKVIVEHFKDRHAANYISTTDEDVNLDEVNVKEDDRRVFLYAQSKLLFILTFKVDTAQKMAYWIVQHIGTKKSALQHIYEIHVTSNKDERRKVIFMEHCFNDALKAEEVFRLGKCGVMPLDILFLFVKDKKLSFRFFIKRIPGKGDDKGNTDNKGPNTVNKGPYAVNKGPNKPKGPKPGLGPKGAVGKV